jgi:simple sugar transport system ATP-binding protein
MSAPPLIEARSISKHFGGVTALKDVSLVVGKGEIVGIVGDNAAGKSTLMKVLSGAYQPDSGTLLVDGKPVAFAAPGDARALGIEMIYQDFALVPQLEVSANIFLGREILKKVLGLKLLNGREMDRAARRMFETLGLRVPSMKNQVRDLSGGQQQAVAIARATAFEAQLVIMDEPTANLGASAIEKVREAIRRLQSRGIAVVIISHRLEDVLTTGDRVVVMKRGHVVGERPIAETFHDEVLEMIVSGIDRRASLADTRT